MIESIPHTVLNDRQDPLNTMNMVYMYIYVTNLGGNMARFTQFPLMITRLTIIYEIISPGAAGSSIYV